MKNAHFVVRKVAILGAGVMGAQIAAHMVNANIETVLYELPAETGNLNANVIKAVEQLKKFEPSPLSIKTRAAYIQPANYDQHLELLKDCDVVIEAIAERIDWKQALYEKVAPYLGEQTLFVSNTSGLSINTLAQALPETLRHRFCGVHFFNPPRYMHLVELIPCAQSDNEMLDHLESFLVTYLGKGVIRAKDTPNFIANRIGVFSLLATMHHGQSFGLTFDEVDALTGTLIGRPKSATYRTADVVGLDVLAHVIHTMRDTLPDDHWHSYFEAPDWLRDLIDDGALGQKTKRGVYQKVGKEIQIFDLGRNEYRTAIGEVAEDLKQQLKLGKSSDSIAVMHDSEHKQGQFLWAIHRDLFHYCAVQLESIADNTRDLDLAIRWGFGWKRGPFEIWQNAGWQQIVDWINADIAAGKSMRDTPLPAWVYEIGKQQMQSVHTPQGSYAPLFQSLHKRSTLPVYQRQLYPDRLVGESVDYGETILETDAIRLWHTGDKIAILSFKSKMHTISKAVLNGMQDAIKEAEMNWQAMVIWQTEPPFSAGADLKQATEHITAACREQDAPLFSSSTLEKLLKQFRRSVKSETHNDSEDPVKSDTFLAEKLTEVMVMIEQFQQTSQALRYSMIPTVAAVDGLALGGGCEFVMHCDRTVATLETYIGLVEAGVGLLPAGGGCKEFALRSAQTALEGDPFPQLKKYYQTVAMAELAKSAEQGKALGFLRQADSIIMNRFELLHTAKHQALALAESGYRPPLKSMAIPVAGNTGIATIESMLVNMHEGAFISDHDYLIGKKIAYVMCGGDLTPGSLVDEEWLLELERTAFIELLVTEKTQARIAHTMKTGKPLRN